MSNYTAEATNNFWSHFQDGITYGELLKLTPEESRQLQSEHIAKVVVESEVELEIVAA